MLVRECHTLLIVGQDVFVAAFSAEGMLKAENQILRSRLPEPISLTQCEKNRLVRFAAISWSRCVCQHSRRFEIGLPLRNDLGCVIQNSIIQSNVVIWKLNSRLNGLSKNNMVECVRSFL